MNRREAFRARGLERVVIFDRGNVEFGLPRGWSAEPQIEGHMKCEDPTKSALLEVSYLGLPAFDRREFPVAERLRLVMAEDATAAMHTPIVTFTRGDADFAWADYAYECDDTERGERRRPAHGRWMIASNDLFQALLMYYYWTDDASWAVRAWKTIVRTVRLGNGIPLETPRDHWSMRDES